MRRKTKSKTIFLFGLLAGIIITVLIIFILNNIKIPNKAFIKKPNHSNITPSKLINHQQKSNPANNYEFYNLLPKSEPPNSNNNLINKKQYYIQVGAFNKLIEADALKAKLTIQGFETTTEISSITSEHRYKVLLGPFTSEEIAKSKQRQVNFAGFKNTIIQTVIQTTNNKT